MEVEVGGGGERQTMRFLISRGGVAVLVHRCPSDWPAAARYACAGVPFLVRVLNFIIIIPDYLYPPPQTANIDLSLFVPVFYFHLSASAQLAHYSFIVFSSWHLDCL